MSTALMLTDTNPAESASGDDDLRLPGWLYRSEAFAEDLGGADEPARRAPVRIGVVSAVLYGLTLALAVLASLPSTLLSA